MDNQHITNAEWLDYWTKSNITPEKLRLYARVHAHIGKCAHCNAIHQTVSSAQEALKTYRLLIENSTKSENHPGTRASVVEVPNEYRAVAGSTHTQQFDPDIAVEIVFTGGTYRFVPNSLLYKGDGRMYEFQPDKEMRCLTDACNSRSRIWFDGNKICACLSENEFSAAILARNGGKIALVSDQNGNFCAELNTDTCSLAIRLNGNKT